jgi:hypothetical protein
MFSRLLVLWSRFAFSGWVMAAALFVVTGVREVTHAGFDSLVRDQLVTLRFPAYYAFGFTLVGSGLAAMILGYWLTKSTTGCNQQGCGCIRWPAFLGLAALCLMSVDYVWVYLPLEEMITPPGKPRTPDFIALHKWSMYGNLVHVGLALLTAWCLCWPSAQTASKPHSPGSPTP